MPVICTGNNIVITTSGQGPMKSLEPGNQGIENIQMQRSLLRTGRFMNTGEATKLKILSIISTWNGNTWFQASPYNNS